MLITTWRVFLANTIGLFILRILFCSVQKLPNHFHDYYVIGLIEQGSRLLTYNTQKESSRLLSRTLRWLSIIKNHLSNSSVKLLVTATPFRQAV